MVADSDVEMENATSARTSAAVNLISSAEDECETKMGIHETERLGSERNCKPENVVHVIESTEHDSVAKTEAGATDPGSQGFLHPKGETVKLDTPYWSSISRDRDEPIKTRNDEGHPSDSENVDVIYSESLIVRESNSAQSDHSTRNGPAANFKRFRKVNLQMLAHGCFISSTHQLFPNPVVCVLSWSCRFTR